LSGVPKASARFGTAASRTLKVLGSTWGRAVFTVACLAIVISQIDTGVVEDRIESGRPLVFAAAVLVGVACLALGALRWRLLLRGVDFLLGVGPTLRIYFVATFSGTVLPSSVGGDVARSFLVVRRGLLLGRVAGTVVADRIFALAALIVVAWAGAIVRPSVTPGSMVGILGAATAGLVLVGVLGAWVLRARPEPLLRRLGPRVRAGLASGLAGFSGSLRSPGLVAKTVVISLAIQVLAAWQIVLLARAIDIDIPIETAALALALVTLASLFPFSIAGFGIREGSYAVVLGAAGVTTTDATIVSLLTFVALAFASLPGAVGLAVWGAKPLIESSPAT
jgi:uncharacterized membrane protein YbhN (UPF0104 family)